MKKYFQIYIYSNELKEKMEIYKLNGKTDIWWKDIKKVKNIKEHYVTWKNIKKYYKINIYWNNIIRKNINNFMS